MGLSVNRGLKGRSSSVICKCAKGGDFNVVQMGEKVWIEVKLYICFAAMKRKRQNVRKTKLLALNLYSTKPYLGTINCLVPYLYQEQTMVIVHLNDRYARHQIRSEKCGNLDNLQVQQIQHTSFQLGHGGFLIISLPVLFELKNF